MRKRSLATSIGVTALLVLAVAPGASAQGQFGDVMVIQPPATPLAEGVWVPLGGGFGDVMLVPPPAIPLAEGVWVPQGGGFGDVAVLPNAAALEPGVFVPRGGGLGDVEIEEPLAPPDVQMPVPPMPAPRSANTCYLGACADQTLAGAVPDSGEIFGGGAHSYGPQQALRLGVLPGGVAITFSF